MATDSAITWHENGKIDRIDETGWSKLIRVPSIYAGVSYWGEIGQVYDRDPFDQFLKRELGCEKFTDLPGLADHLAAVLNREAKGKPIAGAMGVHVAGYHPWEDGVRRPTLFHVHNGHAKWEIGHSYVASGDIVTVHSGSNEIGRVELGQLSQVTPHWVAEPRKVFEKYQDFPHTDCGLAKNLRLLDTPRITRNGQFLYFAFLWGKVQEAIEILNRIPEFSIPRDPADLGCRKGYIHTALEIAIGLYRVSNQSRVVGGTVSSLGIGDGRFVL